MFLALCWSWHHLFISLRTSFLSVDQMALKLPLLYIGWIPFPVSSESQQLVFVALWSLSAGSVDRRTSHSLMPPPSWGKLWFSQHQWNLGWIFKTHYQKWSPALLVSLKVCLIALVLKIYGEKYQQVTLRPNGTQIINMDCNRAQWFFGKWVSGGEWGQHTWSQR